MRFPVILMLVVFLSACQSLGDKPAPELAGQATPLQVGLGQRAITAGESVTWGGEVQSIRNLQRVTQIEILSYPVGSHGKPLTGERASGRFVVEMEGFLEPRELSTGTPVTVKGTYARTLEGKVGEAAYRFPLLMGERLDVWPRPRVARHRESPDVRWSIGIGSGGSGVGVGIGF